VLAGLPEKYPQILCVSHLPEVKSMFEKVTMITKHNGISKIDKPNSNM
jgi:DNA repair ATPase RecN